MTMQPLLPRLAAPNGDEAIRVDGAALSYGELATAAAATARRLAGIDRVALWAEPKLETVVGLVAALAAGRTVVPINPGAGESELEHIASDSRPEAILAASESALPVAFAGLTRLEPDLAGDGVWAEADVAADAPAIVFYTSGTTDTPKGVLLPRRAIAANLDALAEAWAWTAADRLTHGLPLFHVHGLVLGILGPLRLGGRVDHVGRFSPEAIAASLGSGATMVFGVPTMYSRLADAAERDAAIADALAGARLLVSGSAALPTTVHTRIERACGQRIVERYGMTETLMITAIRSDGERAPGCVGTPLPGVEVRLVDDDGMAIDDADDEAIGEVAVAGESMFCGYLNRDDATAAAFRDGWFLTGDLATRAPNGYLRIVGRRSTDIIKSGGYKVGALEVESALLAHDAVAEAAVAGVPDDDLGERIAAWVVLRDGHSASADELMSHTRQLLASHKRAREVHIVDALPRNAMGKVMKRELSA